LPETRVIEGRGLGEECPGVLGRGFLAVHAKVSFILHFTTSMD